MARVKAIWGPYQSTEHNAYCRWMFSGLRENNEYCGWSLRFFFDTRRFSCQSVMNVRGKQYAERMLQSNQLELLPEIQRADVTAGRVTDMLVARLKPEDIARATALAIQYRGP